MSRSMKGGLYGRRKRALARLEIALEAADPTEITKVNRMKKEIETLKERLAGK